MVIGRKSMEELLKYKNSKWKTSITKVEPNRIVTRGYAQEDLIGSLSFPDMVYLLMNGNKPTKNESKMIEAVLISFCDHGTTPPSTQVARLMASTGSSLNTCVSGGLMAFGKYHAGALEECMKLIQERVDKGVMGEELTTIAYKDHKKSSKKVNPPIDSFKEFDIPINPPNKLNIPLDSPKDVKILASQIVEEYLKNNRKIPGFGHRYHEADPRAPKLLKLAKKYGFCGIHTQLALALQDILQERKNILLNVDGANAGILSDMGFSWKVGTGIFMIGRMPALIAHVNEEQNQESPFRKFIESEEILYSGFREKNSG